MVSIRNELEKVRKSGIKFLRSEIDTAHTLADIALASGNDANKRQRNAGKARTAYEAVVRFADRVSLTSEEARELRVNLETLKSKLTKLGEQLD